MLKDVLIKLNPILSKAELNTVVVYKPPNETATHISSSTPDELCMISVSCKYDYGLNEFAFRSWESLNSIFNILGDEVNLNVMVDAENYPSLFEFHNNDKTVKLTHYLQNYSFIRNQDELHNQYKQKKQRFYPKFVNNISLTPDTVKQLSRISSLLKETKIYIKQDLSTGEVFFLFGDENCSADTAKIKVADNLYEDIEGVNGYPVHYFINMYNAMCKYEDFSVIITKNYIMMSAKSDLFDICVLVRGQTA